MNSLNEFLRWRELREQAALRRIGESLGIFCTDIPAEKMQGDSVTIDPVEYAQPSEPWELPI